MRNFEFFEKKERGRRIISNIINTFEYIRVPLDSIRECEQAPTLQRCVHVNLTLEFIKLSLTKERGLLGTIKVP